MAKDKTMTAVVLEVLSTREGKPYGFKVPMNDGTVQKFTLGLRADGCPKQGMIVRIEFNTQPGNEEYPDETYWCNEWTNTNGASLPPDAYERKAQEIDAQEAALGNTMMAEQPPATIRRFGKEEAIQMEVCIKAVTEALIANLGAVGHNPEADPLGFMITPAAIANDAELLYQTIFVHGGRVAEEAAMNAPEGPPQDAAPLPVNTGP